MVNSLTDLIQDAVWNMVKNDWRTVMYWTWNTGIPCGVGILVWFVGSFRFLMYRDHVHWALETGIFFGMCGVGVLVSIAVMAIQQYVLQVLGKSDYFEQWGPTPSVYDRFDDHEDEF